MKNDVTTGVYHTTTASGWARASAWSASASTVRCSAGRSTRNATARRSRAPSASSSASHRSAASSAPVNSFFPSPLDSARGFLKQFFLNRILTFAVRCWVHVASSSHCYQMADKKGWTVGHLVTTWFYPTFLSFLATSWCFNITIIKNECLISLRLTEFLSLFYICLATWRLATN